MPLLTFETEFLEQQKGLLTAREIAGQPELWKETGAYFQAAANKIDTFFEVAYSQADNIILTGAGTSAFIGLSLEGAFFRHTGLPTNAVATTDIVSHPQNYFSQYQTSFIISFARSGNSPESCAALQLADKLSKKCFHLIITCDKAGALAKYESENLVCLFTLPEAANDKSLAMTGSYSAMLLAGLLVANIDNPDKAKRQVQLVAEAADRILIHNMSLIKDIAGKDFKRAVFLGSGNLFGTAKEAALKLQELTDGIIICKEDTYLGLRHGPKAVINESTLVIYFFSSSHYIKQYENDLVKAMRNGNSAMCQLGVGEQNDMPDGLDAQICFGSQEEQIDEDFLPVCSIVVGQLLGFYKSLQIGLSPDNPSVNGSITRVVQGVTIYPLPAEKRMVSVD